MKLPGWTVDEYRSISQCVCLVMLSRDFLIGNLEYHASQYRSLLHSVYEFLRLKAYMNRLMLYVICGFSPFQQFQSWM